MYKPLAAVMLAGSMSLAACATTQDTAMLEDVGTGAAIGAAAGDVLVQFLIEAVVLSTLGGCIGIGFGFGLSLPPVIIVLVILAFNLPNIPDQLYYTEAAKRLGIIYTPVFGGFSAKSVQVVEKINRHHTWERHRHIPTGDVVADA